MSALQQCVCASSTLPAWIKVKRKTPTTPSHGRHARESTWCHMTVSNHASPRGDGGCVSDGRRVPPKAPPLYKSLLMGRKTGFGGRGVWAGPIGPTGAPLFTRPSDQNKCRGLHPSALPPRLNKQTNKRGNMIQYGGVTGGWETRGWRTEEKLEEKEYRTVFDKDPTLIPICLDCSCQKDFTLIINLFKRRGINP